MMSKNVSEMYRLLQEGALIERVDYGEGYQRVNTTRAVKAEDLGPNPVRRDGRSSRTVETILGFHEHTLAALKRRGLVKLVGYSADADYYGLVKDGPMIDEKELLRIAHKGYQEAADDGGILCLIHEHTGEPYVDGDSLANAIVTELREGVDIVEGDDYETYNNAMDAMDNMLRLIVGVRMAFQDAQHDWLKSKERTE